jgi:hypothetical protein
VRCWAIGKGSGREAGVAALSDLGVAAGGGDLVSMELLGAGWCLCRWRSGGICAGGEVRSVVAYPPSLFRLGGVLGALVAISAVQWVVPRWWR